MNEPAVDGPPLNEQIVLMEELKHLALVLAGILVAFTVVMTLVAYTVYECGVCGERSIGQQRCAQDNVFGKIGNSGC